MRTRCWDTIIWISLREWWGLAITRIRDDVNLGCWLRTRIQDTFKTTPGVFLIEISCPLNITCEPNRCRFLFGDPNPVVTGNRAPKPVYLEKKYQTLLVYRLYFIVVIIYTRSPNQFDILFFIEYPLFKMIIDDARTC